MCSRFAVNFTISFSILHTSSTTLRGQLSPPLQQQVHHISYPNISKIERKISCACHEDDVLTAHTHFLPWTTLGTKSLESAKFKGWCFSHAWLYPTYQPPPRKLLTPPLYKMASHINWTFRVLRVRHGQTMCHSPVRKF